MALAIIVFNIGGGIVFNISGGVVFAIEYPS
jgi:hypothetical protein